MDAVLKPDLLNLPWATLLTLASGYAGYFVSNVGLRDHHRPIDVTFSTLVFGFFSAFVYAWLQREFELRLLAASAVSFGSALLFGGIWARLGRPMFERLLRVSDVSLSDDLPSAWIALFKGRGFAKQLSIKLKDGSWIKCDDLAKFRRHPNGPCVLGAKGDVLMYVTHVQYAESDEFEICDGVENHEWGDEITYVPADQIVRLDYRRLAR